MADGEFSQYVISNSEGFNVSPRPKMDLLATAMALKEPEEKDWIAGAKPQTGTNLRVTSDTELTSRLRGGGFVEVLQAPQRGRQPATGRPKYILKVYPNADGPAAPIGQGPPSPEAPN